MPARHAPRAHNPPDGFSKPTLWHAPTLPSCPLPYPPPSSPPHPAPAPAVPRQWPCLRATTRRTVSRPLIPHVLLPSAGTPRPPDLISYLDALCPLATSRSVCRAGPKYKSIRTTLRSIIYRVNVCLERRIEKEGKRISTIIKAKQWYDVTYANERCQRRV